ncbi:hypothetical protein [Neisseria sicca]|uniref:hypothetical protein n=1 Tax=Neisseria sicca TaxID=490 RepID=UPI001649B599|nr:hypothetical protein [Neisseria sicca]
MFLPHGNVSGLQTDRSSENFFRRPLLVMSLNFQSIRQSYWSFLSILGKRQE